MGRREHSSGAKALKKYADSLEDFAEMGFSASGGRDGKNRLSTGNLRQAAHKLGRKQRELEKKLGLTPDQRITGTMPSEKIDAAEKRRLLRQQAELDSDRERKISDGSESIADDLRTVLAQASLTAETAKDQHFLVSQEAMDKILAAANLGQGDVIIEIGPGPGHVTRRLAERAGKLHVIELDTKFKEVLHGLAGELGNIDIIFGSAVDKSIPWPKDATKIVTNLPYSILEPFLLRLALEKNIDEVTLMTGESYYRRLTAGLAHTSKTGIITQAF